MKLSDIKGERVFDVVADMIEPVANIASDKEAMGLIKNFHGKDRKELLARAKEIAPKILKGHKRDFVTIFAALEGVSTKEYLAKLNMPKLITDLIELLTDESFGELFTDAQTTQNISAE